ncbi:DUF29 domain-containing protein [Synechocystis sp. LKSZ1]|uniref:DUF29 domain-containing protein n=1 Tax=Synechocystis sp. LKSZ1 TaxID=3144951 RepID=UPI00336BE2A5
MKLKTKGVLYETDFALWIEETLALLNARNFAQLDLEHLMEEIEALGISQRKAVASFLVRLFEHLLKRCYVNLPDCYRGWEIEIRNFRRELKRELKYSPSLQRFMLDIWPESYQEALGAMQEDYPETAFPQACPWPLDSEVLLNQAFWQDIEA